MDKLKCIEKINLLFRIESKVTQTGLKPSKVKKKNNT